MIFHTQVRYIVGAAIVTMAASGCGGSQNSMPTAPPANAAMQRQLPSAASPADGRSILKQLTNQVVIPRRDRRRR